MKLLYISSSEIPSKKANSVHVMKMCGAFSLTGVNTTLLCIGDSEVRNSDYSLYGQADSFLIKKISNKGRILPFRSVLFYYFRSYLFINKRISNYDCFYGRSIPLIYLLRKKRTFAYESHMPPRNIVYKFLEHRLLISKNLQKLVVISAELKNEYLKIYPFLKSDKIVVLHDGANKTNGTENKAKLLTKGDSCIIGYLGHLYPGKCMEVLSNIAILNNKITFHVIGGTSQWVEHWKLFLEEKGIKNIVLYGYVENKDVSSYYSAFDICILPFSRKVYLNNNEMEIGKWFSPIKLFEAMAHGKAIIASDLPTIREVITSGVDGILCNPDKPEEWIEALNMLMHNKVLRQQLGTNAKKLLDAKYSWEKRAKEIESILNT